MSLEGLLTPEYRVISVLTVRSTSTQPIIDPVMGILKVISGIFCLFCLLERDRHEDILFYSCCALTTVSFVRADDSSMQKKSGKKETVSNLQMPLLIFSAYCLLSLCCFGLNAASLS